MDPNWTSWAIVLHTFAVQVRITRALNMTFGASQQLQLLIFGHECREQLDVDVVHDIASWHALRVQGKCEKFKASISGSVVSTSAHSGRSYLQAHTIPLWFWIDSLYLGTWTLTNAWVEVEELGPAVVGLPYSRLLHTTRSRDSQEQGF